MELAQILKTLKERKLAVVAIIIVATLPAIAVGYRISGFPPKLSSRSVASGTATTQILIDSPQSAIADLKQDTAPLVTRATVFAQFMTSTTIRQRIADATGIPMSQITAEGPFSGPSAGENVVTPSEARGGQVRAETQLYRLSFVAQDQLPLITVYATAPTAGGAAKLANGVYAGVRNYIDGLESEYSTDPKHRVTVRQLGLADAGTVHSGASKVLMILAFLAFLTVGCLALIGGAGLRQRKVALEDAIEPLEQEQAVGPFRGAPERESPDPHLPKIGIRGRF
jgi:hypothetical protein